MKKQRKDKEMASKLDLDGDGIVSKWELFPYWFDKLRVFPRIFITVYIYIFWECANWFMLLPDPNNAQAGLVSVVVGAGAAWFGLYVNSSKSSVKITSDTETKVKK
jgi:hypothetical protein